MNLTSAVPTGNDLLMVNYSDPSKRFTVQLQFLLTGSDPGSGLSDISETVRVKNVSGAPLDFHLYEYVNVDLLGVAQPIDSLLQMTGTPVNTATQTNGTANLSETVVTPAPSLYQAGNAAQLLAKLSSGSVYNLNDTSSALNDDLAWAFQWDATLASSGLGSTFLVSKDKQLDVVPEPSTLVLLEAAAIGLLVFAWRRRGLAS